MPAGLALKIQICESRYPNCETLLDYEDASDLPKRFLPWLPERSSSSLFLIGLAARLIVEDRDGLIGGGTLVNDSADGHDHPDRVR